MTVGSHGPGGLHDIVRELAAWLRIGTSQLTYGWTPGVTERAALAVRSQHASALLRVVEA